MVNEYVREARMRIKRENEKKATEEIGKKKSQYIENLEILNYLEILVQANKTDSFETILNNYILNGKLKEPKESNYTLDFLRQVFKIKIHD